MEEVNNVLALFDSAEKWNAFIELSNMRSAMVEELKSRLQNELQKIANKELIDSGWEYECRSDNGVMSILPIGTSLIKIALEWDLWIYDDPWRKRGAGIWIHANSECIDPKKVFELIKSNKASLPLQDYEENFHETFKWYPFIKRIPSSVFGVDDSVTSVDECLYMAKDNAAQLAKNIWENLFKPFATKENAELMKSFVTP